MSCIETNEVEAQGGQNFSNPAALVVVLKGGPPARFITLYSSGAVSPHYEKVDSAIVWRYGVTALNI